MILLLERSGTGYADGQLCPPSGHLEEGESVACCAIREAAEEVGVDIDPADLVFTHVVHHRNPEGQGRVGFFFTATRWAGVPVNREPHKCAGSALGRPRPPPGRHCALHGRSTRRYRSSERSSPLTAGDLARSWKDAAVAGLAMPAPGTPGPGQGESVNCHSTSGHRGFAVAGCVCATTLVAMLPAWPALRQLPG